MLTSEGAVDASDTAYTLVGTTDDLEVSGEGKFTAVVIISARSVLYGVPFTFTILKQTLVDDGAPPLISLKTSEVNVICGHPHVQDFWTERDQGTGNEFYHFAVITVGTDDQAITTQVRQRMDEISGTAVFTNIDKAWKQLQAIGAT